MSVVLGYLYHRMGRYPARDAEHETVKILAAEHVECMRDITLLVVVGHGVDRYGVYALCV